MLDVALASANPSNLVNSVQAAVHAAVNPVAPPPPSIPPFVAHNPPSKSSLYDLFPTIEAGQLLEIARHEFRPVDLHKLDSTFRDRFDIDRPDDAKGRTAKGYPSLHSLISPLFTYFRILSAFAASSGDAEATRVIADGSARYYEHLHDMHQRFEWSAVVEYHLHYHLIRRREMANGDYSGWGPSDGELMNRFLFSRPRLNPDSKRGTSSASPKSKSSKPISEQFCFNFNKGDCTSSPCPDGRMHKCRKCNGDHTEKTCKR
ncbi:hypothetical protein C8R46DRAFT_914220 [Mycena filopes]|nr:hypothetical protein C8R46DRAFT_914220 [Mycena filopes]